MQMKVSKTANPAARRSLTGFLSLWNQTLNGLWTGLINFLLLVLQYTVSMISGHSSGFTMLLSHQIDMPLQLVLSSYDVLKSIKVHGKYLSHLMSFNQLCFRQVYLCKSQVTVGLKLGMPIHFNVHFGNILLNFPGILCSQLLTISEVFAPNFSPAAIPPWMFLP